MQRMIKRAREEGGFTLIELMIVIVILGILAGIVLFAVGGITDRGTKAACKTDLSTIQTGVEAYYAKNGAYVDMAGLVSNKLLREAPETTHYVISINTSNGNVTADHSNCTSL